MRQSLITVAHNCTVCIIYNNGSIMLQDDIGIRISQSFLAIIFQQKWEEGGGHGYPGPLVSTAYVANLYAWMCIAWKLEFVVIVRQGYSLNVHITMQIIYLVKWHRDRAWYKDSSLTTWVSVVLY